MIYKVIILPLAVQDIKEINFFYKTLNENLAILFNNNLKNEIKIIKENPFVFQVKYDDFRTVKVDKFPYLIHFEIHESSIVINAIYHTSRDSKIWLNRD